MYHILICDDEKDIVAALEIYLKAEGYATFCAYNGKEALELIEREEIHLVLLDIMMPEMDGIAAISKIREISNVPVIFLTAKSEDMDKVLGLTVGADDYITKPFNPVELQARVKSQLRRYLQLGGGRQQEDLLCIGGIVLDDRAKEVMLDGEPVSLTKTEYDILRFLMKNPGESFSPRAIYQKVWKDVSYGTENTVAVHIRHLREKIEYDPANPRYLKAVWGRGYKLEGKERMTQNHQTDLCTDKREERV
ncbi:MAG: response regulator transcription factor [Clostridiaceae bacterium]|nr:response regulator transcription factor [Clostridiaceae bacterium]